MKLGILFSEPVSGANGSGILYERLPERGGGLCSGATDLEDEFVPLRPLIVAASTIVLVACGDTKPAYGPAADAARRFRPLGDVVFLPDRVPLVTHDGSVPKIPDSKIEWNVRAKLAEARIEGVSVTVDEQIVVLEGRVPDPRIRERTQEIALSVAGVAGVRNRMEVGQ